MRFIPLKAIIVRNKEFEYFDIYVNLFNIEAYHALELVDKSNDIMDEGVRIYLKSGMTHDLSMSISDFDELMTGYFT